MSTLEYHDEEDPSFSFPPPPAPPDPTQDKKRNRLTKVLSGHFKREVDKDKLTSEYDISAIDEEEFQTFAKKAFAMYDENKDGVLDEMEMNKLLRDAYIMGGKNLALKQANVKQAKKTKRWKRNTVGVMVILMLVLAVMVVQTFFLNQSNVRDGSETREEVKRTKVLEVSPSDEAGHGHLQDVSGTDLSVHSHGDKFTATSIVDPITSDVVECMETGEVAMMTAGVENGASVRLNYKDPVTGLTSDSFTVSDGDFHDKYDHLAFHGGKVKVLFNSNRCNVLLSKSPPSPPLEEVVEDPVQVEESSNEEVDTKEDDKKDIDYKLDIEPALQDALDKAQADKKNVSSSRSKGLFGRLLRDRFAGVPPQDGGAGALSHQSEDSKAVTLKEPPMANPSARIRVVDKSKGYHHQSIRAGINGMTDIGLRNREIYMAHCASIQSTGRRMETEGTDYVETCSEDNCQSPTTSTTSSAQSDFELRDDLTEASECPVGRELTESECQEAASELEVGEFDGVWNRDGAENLPCGCFLWDYPNNNYHMVLYRNEQAGCGAGWVQNLGMICKKDFCTITEGYSDGSAGNLTLTTDSTGNQVLAFVKEDGTIDSSSFSGSTLGTAPNVTTVIEDVNYFTIAAGQTVNVLGTLIVKGKRIQIDGTLNGSGGGYAGAVASTTALGAWALPGESPPDTNGHGTGGRGDSVGTDGGGGGSHAGGGGRGGEQGNIAWTSSPGDVYDDALPLTLRPGSGGGGGAGSSSINGGAGGAGGAAMIFYSEEIVLNGNIYANGSNGGRGPDTGALLAGGGGGSGGSIRFSTCTLTAGSSAEIEAKGGTGGQARSYGYGGGGGGGGVYKHEATTVNYDDSMTINVDGGARGGGDSSNGRYGFAGSAGKVFLTDNLELEASCDLIPSYLDTSAPLDKNSRCVSGFCRSSDNKCGCTSSEHCSSSQVCHSDNKCYTSGLSYEDDQDCSVDDGTALNDRCASGFCRSTDDKCGCTSSEHCSPGQVCHTDNKCYSSGLGYEDDCAAENGDDVDARCASGKCRSSDNKCGCTNNDHCPSDKVCKTSTNTCETQAYSLVAQCDLGVSGEGTNSRVSLEVKHDNGNVDDFYEMDSRSAGCPDHTFEVDGRQEPDQYEIRIHGNDKLGVNYFFLFDATNEVEIRRWGDGENYCFSNDGTQDCWSGVGAFYPRRGIILERSGSVDLIKFSGGQRCKRNPTCSSGSCVNGGGSCSITAKCCSPG